MLTSRLRIDQFINITEIENKRVELIRRSNSSSSSGKVDTRGESENKRNRNKKNEQGT
jgi:hypothetical protein